MKLSAPIYHLKRKARLLSRKDAIPLSEALDRIATSEGFGTWSLLAAKHACWSNTARLLSQLQPGDMMLLAARPGQGKTLVSLNLAVQAMKAGRHSVFFSLEYTKEECRERFEAVGANLTEYGELLQLDCSDHICADTIASTLASAPRGTLAVIDYLQLLDQKRENPELIDQVRALGSFAREHGVIMVFISQIDRSYDSSSKPCPDLSDVRLPNHLDLKLFNKALFLNNGEARFSTIT